MTGIILSAIIENVSTRADGTVKVVLGCQEMSASRAGELMTLNRKLAAVYLSPKESVNQKEVDQLSLFLTVLFERVAVLTEQVI